MKLLRRVDHSRVGSGAEYRQIRESFQKVPVFDSKRNSEIESRHHMGERHCNFGQIVNLQLLPTKGSEKLSSQLVRPSIEEFKRAGRREASRIGGSMQRSRKLRGGGIARRIPRTVPVQEMNLSELATRRYLGR